jgi:hypothetical protein
MRFKEQDEIKNSKKISNITEIKIRNNLNI